MLHNFRTADQIIELFLNSKNLDVFNLTVLPVFSASTFSRVVFKYFSLGLSSGEY
jgi:hypothetical protein